MIWCERLLLQNRKILMLRQCWDRERTTRRRACRTISSAAVECKGRLLSHSRWRGLHQSWCYSPSAFEHAWHFAGLCYMYVSNTLVSIYLFTVHSLSLPPCLLEFVRQRRPRRRTTDAQAALRMAGPQATSGQVQWPVDDGDQRERPP